MTVVTLSAREAKLRRAIRAHLRGLGFSKDDTGALIPPSLDKAGYRKIHGRQRLDRLAEESSFIGANSSKLIRHFATGSQIDVTKIRVRLELIRHTTWQADLFRFATLLWSVPVSKGFGRRLRFLVWDDHSETLIGVFALGDPVFNLGARDKYIGWSTSDRESRLVGLLDGYVVGAVPPFNQLLGGKLIASLMRTEEVVRAFRERYRSTEGIISGSSKNAHLVAVTTTSSLGRSSVYNRLRLDGVSYLQPIGFTSGFGHFHFPHDIFDDMRDYLKSRKDPYSNNHTYGEGPNWRLRTIRRSLQLLDLDPNLVRHGLLREVFISHLADNALDVLNGKRLCPKYESLRSAGDVAELALARWVRPRAMWDFRYRSVSHEDILRSIHQGSLIQADSRKAIG